VQQGRRSYQKLAKISFLRASKSLGLFHAYANSQWRQQRLLILCYHGLSILDEHEWNPALYMAPEQFAARMELLRRYGYNVLPLAEAVRRLFVGDLPPRSVCLTFDDGTADFYHVAHPILKQFGFPSTVYLTTYYCFRQLPVFDVMCSYLLWKGQDATASIADLVGAQSMELRSSPGRRAAVTAIKEHCRRFGFSAVRKHRLLTEIAERLDIDFRSLVERRLLQIMTPEEVADLANQGVAVQLHTRRHRTPIDRELFLQELEDNHSDIKAITHSSANHFCYPYGFVEAPFVGWLREFGIETATTTNPGLATRKSDPLLLPRFMDWSGLNAVEFEAWLAGFAMILPRQPGPVNVSPDRQRSSEESAPALR
jgi:peptidoglycan/xylan/chitin deacetylase (PgdA/CDA1 family)